MEMSLKHWTLAVFFNYKFLFLPNVPQTEIQKAYRRYNFEVERKKKTKAWLKK